MDTANMEHFALALGQATVQSLAEWGFIDIKNDSYQPGDEAADNIVIKIGIDRPLAGEMFFSFTTAMAKRIAENLFKGEMLISHSILKDILGESSNIIAGRCFQLFAPQGRMAFSIPEVGCELPADNGAYTHIAFLTYEKERVCIAYRLHAVDEK